VELDPRAGQKLRHDRARLCPEGRHRLGLGRDQMKTGVLDPGDRDRACGQERQLVQRQRPAGHARRDEGHAPDRAALEVAHELANGLAGVPHANVIA
jgi:hypothetical protein